MTIMQRKEEAMAYSRHTWQTGDVVSVSRLNNIEDGIEGGFLVKHTVTNGVLDCSYNDLVAEVNAGRLPYLYDSSVPFSPLVKLYTEYGPMAYFGDINNIGYANSDPDQPLVYND